MRFVLVRSWAIVAAAILTGALADAAVDRDNHYQGVLPALEIGAVAAVFLVLFTLLARIGPCDPLLTRMNDIRTRVVDIAGALCGSALCVVAMEGYETRFGGLSPFDARSVVCTHAFALIVAFVIVGAMLHYALRGAIRIASRATDAVTSLVVSFLRKLAPAAASPLPILLSVFALRVPHAPRDVAAGSQSLRAPPRPVPSVHFIAT